MGEIRDSFDLLVRVGTVIVVHFILAVIVLTGVWISEKYYLLLWGKSEVLLYDWVPMRWVFQTLDLGVVITFLIKGTIEVHKAYKRE